MLGEEDPTEEGSLASKGPWSRLLVLSAGSLVMLLFPLIVFPIVYMIPQDVIVDYGSPITITEIGDESPAYYAGVEVGDVLLEIEGTKIETITQLKEVTDESAGKNVKVILLRGSEQIEVEMLSRLEEDWPSGQGAFGITIDLRLAKAIKERESYPPWTAFYKGAKLYGDSIIAMRDGIFAAFRREIPLDVGGVVAGGQITTEIADRGDWRDLLFWAGLLSFNLGLVNLLPIPALDGGRIIFVLIEMARRGKRVSPETEGKIHFVGFVLLIGLIFLITYMDIERIIDGESLLP